jgi:hypothetical protein
MRAVKSARLDQVGQGFHRRRFGGVRYDIRYD